MVKNNVSKISFFLIFPFWAFFLYFFATYTCGVYVFLPNFFLDIEHRLWKWRSKFWIRKLCKTLQMQMKDFKMRVGRQIRAWGCNWKTKTASSCFMEMCTPMCSMSMKRATLANTLSAFNLLRWHSNKSAKLRPKCSSQVNSTGIEGFERKKKEAFLTHQRRIWSGRDLQEISTFAKLRNNSMSLR